MVWPTSPAPRGALLGQARFSSCEGCFIWERFGASRLLLGGGFARSCGGPRRLGVGITSSSLSASSIVGGSSIQISEMMLTSSPSSLSTRTRRTRSCVLGGVCLLSVLPLDPPRECARPRRGAAAFDATSSPKGCPAAQVRCCEGKGLPALCGRGRKLRPWSCWASTCVPALPRPGELREMRRALPSALPDASSAGRVIKAAV